jgi:hypothetical protein
MVLVSLTVVESVEDEDIVWNFVKKLFRIFGNIFDKKKYVLIIKKNMYWLLISIDYQKNARKFL